MQHDTQPNCMIIYLHSTKLFFPEPHRRDGKRGRWRQEQRGWWLELETGTRICLHLKYPSGTKIHSKTNINSLNLKQSQTPTNPSCFTRDHALRGHVWMFLYFQINSLLIVWKSSSQYLTKCANVYSFKPQNLHRRAKSKEPTTTLVFKMKHQAYPAITTHNSRLYPIYPPEKATQ